MLRKLARVGTRANAIAVELNRTSTRSVRARPGSGSGRIEVGLSAGQGMSRGSVLPLRAPPIPELLKQSVDFRELALDVRALVWREFDDGAG
jgi:hypothetical protein